MDIIFIGTSDYGELALESLVQGGHNVKLVVTQPDRRAGRGHKLVHNEIKKMALQLNLAIYQPENINSLESIEFLKGYSCDFMIVVSYGQILKEEILKMAKLEILNIHGSLLPMYRGAAPVERAIMDGMEKTGVTIMKVEKTLDSGPIYQMQEIEITENMTRVQLWHIMKEVGSQLLHQVLDNFETINPLNQDHDLSTYAKKITKEDLVVDFGSVKKFHNLVRGLEGRALIKVLIKELDLEFAIVRGLSFTSNLDELGFPGDFSDYHNGEIMFISKKIGILVKFDDGVYALREVKPFGKKEMDFKSFINGYKVLKGMTLENLERTVNEQ